MELLNLKPARISLEFRVDEWPLISQRLQRFGILERERFATYDQLRVGPESFVLSDDGGELALVSQSPAGDLMLNRIYRNLGTGFSASLLRRSFRAQRVLSPRSVRRAA